jgi:oxygen-independent coproporphyrinogen-3 oxidase
MYILEIYPNAPLRDAMARGRWSLAPDEDVAAMYRSGLDRMDAAGYVQYEISNVARPGSYSRHNLKYWTDGEWLGFGCGAHSTRGGVRWKNLSSTEEYISAAAAGGHLVAERRQMSAEEQIEDALFTGLRLTAGLDLPALKARYGVDVWERFGGELQVFVDEGLLIYDGAALRLTRTGMLLANEIMTVFISTDVATPKAW